MGAEVWAWLAGKWMFGDVVIGAVGVTMALFCLTEGLSIFFRKII